MIHEWREDARAFHYYGMSFSEQRTVQKYILTSLGSGKSIYIRETVNLSASETVPGGEVLPVSLWSHGGVGGGQSCQFGFQVSFCVQIYPIVSTPHSSIPPKSRSPFSIPLAKSGTRTGGKSWNHDDALGWRQGWQRNNYLTMKVKQNQNKNSWYHH